MRSCRLGGPGTFLSNLTCVECGEGQFNDAFGQTACQPCASVSSALFVSRTRVCTTLCAISLCTQSLASCEIGLRLFCSSLLDQLQTSRVLCAGGVDCDFVWSFSAVNSSLRWFRAFSRMIPDSPLVPLAPRAPSGQTLSPMLIPACLLFAMRLCCVDRVELLLCSACVCRVFSRTAPNCCSSCSVQSAHSLHGPSACTLW